MKICLLAGTLVLSLSGERASLAWTHSVERQEWVEDWRAGPEGLTLERARVRGSAAGMEPGEGARLVDGAWEWVPKVPVQRRVTLARSGATADWRICEAGTCRPLGMLAPAAGTIEMTVCDDAGRPIAVRGGDAPAR